MAKPPVSGSKAIQDYGLTQIYTPRDDPTIDIVFVHGLNGHPRNTWTSKATGCFWPTDLLPDVLASLRPRILTYGYNANVTTFTDGTSRDSVVSHAETLASHLAANRNLRNCSDRPIIFICHSLGGLIVKRALIYSRSLSNEKTEHLRSVYVSTFGILFLGTPHNGSDLAKWGLLLRNICNAVLPKKFMETSPQLLKALQTNNEILQHINSLFVDIMGRFHIYFFHETRSTDLHGTREVIVDEHSAAPYMEGVERAGIEADHSHMCKFNDENSAGYEVVAEAVLRYSRQAPAVIAERWVEEKNARAQERKAKAKEIYDARIDDPANRSMPDLSRTGRPPRFLPAPEEAVTLKDYEIEEPTEDITGSRAVYDELHSCHFKFVLTDFFLGEYVPPLPRAPASEGRNSPVSDTGRSGLLQISHHSIKDTPLFVAPPGFHPNATFFGMKKELEILHTRLYKAKARQERTMAVLISGVPGSGKTHLARQYVFTQRGCYPGGIFWIDGKSRESTFKCLWEIAQAATLVESKATPEYYETQTYVNAVRNWFQSRQDWLLVFDGIGFDHDDDINKFKEVLPWSKRSSIIYTSVDATLRKKQRLYEPYCLAISRLQVEDACKLLFKDLGISRPTAEQKSKATRIVEYYEGLPLAIHAVGHHLNATGKPVEKYRVRSRVTDKKLAEPFLGIMNDLFRLQHRQALHLINLLSFLGHQVPVGLLDLGRSVMTKENVEILTSAQPADDPDLDTTLGTLIHYGLIERTSDAGLPHKRSFVQPRDGDDLNQDAENDPELSDPATESSQEGSFSIYQQQFAVDVVKIHSVLQGFCRDELRIMDEETKAAMNNNDPGFYDTWLIVATRFLVGSYGAAIERMANDDTCGLVQDYREYETHASRLLELFPKKPTISLRPHIVGETRDGLRKLMKTISRAIDSVSPSSSQQSIGKQRSVFERLSSSSSSSPNSPADERGISRHSTLSWSDRESPGAESPEELSGPSPQFRVELFAPHIYRQDGACYKSEDGQETDGEETGEARMSPSTSQISHNTEKPKKPPPSPTSPPGSSSSGWHVINRDSKRRSDNKNKAKQSNKGPRRFGSAKADTPLVELSSVQGKGFSSRPVDIEAASSGTSSQAKQALAAVRRSSNSQLQPEAPEAVSTSPPANKENMPTYASVASRQIRKAEPAPMHPPAVHIMRTVDPETGLQMKPSTETLASRATYPFTPDPEGYNYYSGMDYHTAPGSRSESRRGSLANLEVMSASVPSLLSYRQPVTYEENIPVAFPANRPSAQRGPASMPPSISAPGRPTPVAHPSAIMPGASTRVSSAPERTRPSSEPLSRNTSAYSHQSRNTEPVRYPSQYSPPFSPPAAGFPPPTDAVFSPVQRIQPQQQLVPGIWTHGMPMAGSALQTEPVYPGPPPVFDSMDQRLDMMDPGRTAQTENLRFINFGSHRVDVRGARDRLHGAPHLSPQRYQMIQPNFSGQLGQHEGQVLPPLAVYRTRPRSGSSPARGTDPADMGP
ncbi:hypothetical protein N7535_004125 [Penicillium sp. DV-2018c]|nr:hypothetical protein N7535_004125 [Penicillium sp. DV-2018c]